MNSIAENSFDYHFHWTDNVVLNHKVYSSFISYEYTEVNDL